MHANGSDVEENEVRYIYLRSCRGGILVGASTELNNQH